MLIKAAIALIEIVIKSIIPCRKKNFYMTDERPENGSSGGKNILVCPLDWGIGHATRCMPIINRLIARGENVIIAADNRPLAFLKKEYPQLKFIRFPGINVKYPSNNKMVTKLAFMLPGILFQIRKENGELQEIIKKHDIDAVISDNRFGLYSDKVPCVYITHQLFIQAPARFKWLNPLLFKMHKRFIDKYNACWIPDFQGKFSLTGALTNKKKVNDKIFFIGPLTRFNEKYENSSANNNDDFEIVAIVSGPEPQRSIIEKILISQLKNRSEKCLLLQGRPDKQEYQKVNGNLTILSHLPTEKLIRIIKKAKLIISRSGHSTIMDLSALGKRAVFVPTPGQGEQEYLAKYHFSKGHYFFMQQKKINIDIALKESSLYPEFRVNYSPGVLDQQIEKLISLI